MGNPVVFTTTPDLIAACGIDCRFCRAFSREKFACPGCRDDSVSKPKTRVRCQIKTCDRLASNEGYCSDCVDFPCARLEHLDRRYREKYGTSPIDNLISIQVNGMVAFIQSENRKMTCVQCGAMLIMHAVQCPSCGQAWHK